MRQRTKESKNLYEKDFYGWANAQAKHLKKREIEFMDWDNLVEEIESLGRSEKRALQHHLAILLMHMLKIKYQPKKCTRSWDLSVENSQLEAQSCLDDNPSLKPKLKEILKSAYKSARIKAAAETGLEKEVFSQECPWKVHEIFPELKKKYL